MTETAPIITAKDLNLWYGDFKALKDISLDVGEREITALIGPSGCGKSTFLKTLNRMNDLVPGVRIEGDVRLRGQDIFAREMQLTELRRRSTRSYIVSAIFRRNSIFFRPYGGMWRQALESFDVMFVQNEESKKLLAGLGFDNVIVAGDTRFDRVAEIAAAAKHIDIIDRFKGDKRLFVAGSTWTPDEELLIRLINDNPDVKFIVAPHEMDEGRMARLAAEAKGGTLRYTQCTPHTAYGSKQLLILDTVGILASVYGYATWSYIGGGFGVGIHNTLEAAVYGIPVIFGPKYQKFMEAVQLLEAKGAYSIKDYDELKTLLDRFLADELFLRETGTNAGYYVTSNAGATEKIMHMINF